MKGMKGMREGVEEDGTRGRGEKGERRDLKERGRDIGEEE